MSTAALAWAIDGCSPGASAAWALAARAPRVGEILLGGLHLIERILIVGARGEALLQQRLLARQGVVLDREIGLLADDIRARARGLRPQLAGLEPRRGELRLRLLERHPERRRVDPEQQVAALHLAAVPDEHLQRSGPPPAG